MASKKNDRRKAPTERSAPQRRGQELLVDGRRDKSFPIVGLGASAGRLEALGEFFSRMPRDAREPNRDGDGKVAGRSCVALDITFPP